MMVQPSRWGKRSSTARQRRLKREPTKKKEKGRRILKDKYQSVILCSLFGAPWTATDKRVSFAMELLKWIPTAHFDADINFDADMLTYFAIAEKDATRIDLSSRRNQFF
jgi:hypothetical protein